MTRYWKQPTPGPASKWGICQNCSRPALIGRNLKFCIHCLRIREDKSKAAQAMRSRTRRLRRWLDHGPTSKFWNSYLEGLLRGRLNSGYYDPTLLHADDPGPKLTPYQIQRKVIRQRKKDEAKAKRLARYRPLKPPKVYPPPFIPDEPSPFIQSRLAGPNYCTTIWPWA